jgi:hypothetical protein
MSGVRLYDSRGVPLDSPDAEQDETLRTMSRYGVVFSVSFTRPRELSTYFRAYESASGRLEQYYATYTAAGTGGLLAEFRDAVIERAEREYDLRVEESASGENVLNSLDTDDPGSVGSPDQRRRAREELSRGGRLRLGVDSYPAALKLIDELSDARPGLKVAVTEGTSTHEGPMDRYDLVIEKGDHAGLTGLGASAELIDPTPDDESDDPALTEAYPALGWALDAGLVVAMLVAVVVLYGVVAHLAWSGAPPGVGKETGVPFAADVPGIHTVSVNVNNSTRRATIGGSTPARTLHLREYDTTSANDTTILVATTELNVSGDRSVDLTNRTTKVELVYSGPIGNRTLDDANVLTRSETASDAEAGTPTATPIPTDGNRTATPTDGDRTTTPTDGDRTATPTDGNRTATPTDGDRTDGNRTTTPTDGNRTATASQTDGGSPSDASVAAGPDGWRSPPFAHLAPARSHRVPTATSRSTSAAVAAASSPSPSSASPSRGSPTTPFSLNVSTS